MKDAFGVESISKGEYMNSQEKVQRDRRKANRRGTAAGVTVTGTSLAGMASLAFPRAAKTAVMYPSYKVATKAGDSAFKHTVEGNRARAKTATVVMDAAKKVNRAPGLAIAGTLVGGLGAAGGLKLAQMGHNSRSNREARGYNKKNRNSKIKIVPLTHTNRF